MNSGDTASDNDALRRFDLDVLTDAGLKRGYTTGSCATAAVKAAQGRKIGDELRKRGVVALSRSWQGLAEEQPDAYKDVDLVVEVVHNAGLAKKVARLRPIGVIKG